MPVVLFSGGMDSTVALFYALANARGNPVHALSYHYGQRHIGELKAADSIIQQANAGATRFDHRIVVLPPALFPNKASILGTNGAVRKYDSTPSHEEGQEDPAFIPHRNLLFLTIAASYARLWGTEEIITGLRGGFPDCTTEFEWELEEVLEISDPEHNYSLFSPCHGSRAETLGLAYSLPGCWGALAYSMTCFEGTEPPCGKCLPCVKRTEGFAEFGKPDPLIERLAVEEARWYGSRGL